MNIELAKKRAAKFFDYHNLKLPVDVVALLNTFAFVEEEIIPSKGDAICINKTGKPHIIIKKNISKFRKRFTYAHELGHLQIPTHTGMISCSTDLDFSINHNEYMKMEEEANAFAAELLMPEHWLIDMINTYPDYNELIKQVCDTAQVSFMAALYNIIPLSPVNHMFYIQDKINAFCHIKFGSNINQPIFLYKEGSYDPDWLAINMQSKLNDITNETMDVSIIIFKKIISLNTVQKIASYFTDAKSIQTICNSITKKNDISYAHLFKDIKFYLPKGFIIKITCKISGSFTYIYAPETYVRPPEKTNQYTCDEWCNSSSIFHVESIGELITIDVWFFQTSFSMKDINENDNRNSKTIIKSIVYENYSDPQKCRSVLGQINGVIGNLKNHKDDFDKKTFYNILKQKFDSKPNLASITQHRDFNTFLFKKICELYNL